MGDIGRTLIDQFQWFCLKHKAKKFLVRFSYENDGFSIEPVIKQHFIRWKAREA